MDARSVAREPMRLALCCQAVGGHRIALFFLETFLEAGSYLSSNAGTSPAQEASDHD